MSKISAFFKKAADEAGLSDLYANWKAYTREVKREQQRFQDNLQRKADHFGLDRIEQDDKKDREQRRKNRRRRWGLD